ncbi:hypothetical protein KI387_032290, partial [Taxus chinensis]
MTAPGSSADPVDIPVIDLSQFPNELDGEEVTQLQNHELLATVEKACKEWGCFRVVNHGIPVDHLRDVESLIRQAFAMPAEVKERAIIVNPEARSSYNETFDFENLPKSDSVQQMYDKIWPQDGNPEFRETIQGFTLNLAALQAKISKIFIASLGLDIKSVYHSDFEKCKAFMGINHYTPNGEILEEDAEIMHPHTDIGCFTILYNDDEGGLQVRSKKGKWVDIDPVPNSFVIMVSDCVKAWSNGRYHSVEHRVVYKGWKDRISVAYVVLFADDLKIWAAPELIDNDNPRRFKPFNYQPFKDAYFLNYHITKEKLETFIDIYA